MGWGKEERRKPAKFDIEEMEAEKWVQPAHRMHGVRLIEPDSYMTQRASELHWEPMHV
jgi:hypothetical protein